MSLVFLQVVAILFGLIGLFGLVVMSSDANDSEFASIRELITSRVGTCLRFVMCSCMLFCAILSFLRPNDLPLLAWGSTALYAVIPVANAIGYRSRFRPCKDFWFSLGARVSISAIFSVLAPGQTLLHGPWAN